METHFLFKRTVTWCPRGEAERWLSRPGDLGAGRKTTEEGREWLSYKPWPRRDTRHRPSPVPLVRTGHIARGAWGTRSLKCSPQFLPATLPLSGHLASSAGSLFHCLDHMTGSAQVSKPYSMGGKTTCGHGQRDCVGCESAMREKCDTWQMPEGIRVKI